MNSMPILDMTKYFFWCAVVILTIVRLTEGSLTRANFEEKFLKLKNRVEQLEETTQKQSDQLSALQETVSRLTRTTERQSNLINYLRKNMRVYRRPFDKAKSRIHHSELSQSFKSDAVDADKFRNFGKEVNTDVNLKNSFTKILSPNSSEPFKSAKNYLMNRKERFLLPISTPTTPVESVAFYAYMSAPVRNVGPNHVLVFDVVKTNVGNGLHKNTGIFNAPISGVYVFYWNVRVYNEEYYGMELMVNENVAGVFFQHAAYQHNSQGGNLAVVHISQGDDVFVRTVSNPIDQHVGEIFNDWHGRSSFSGWLLL